ncbi:hypothetical protein [Natrinema sp. CBA1119]|uniref:hypothetical protein n=1 Tax=Natrinema sp. CBA1119 TaxID=1608465 RepID=UPI00159B863D|nr:hypothetical protein [Natrinema sp. CBA1119]
MLDAPLHTGAQHPDLLWILVPSFLSFVAGLGLGSVSDRLRNWLRPQQDAANN